MFRSLLFPVVLVSLFLAPSGDKPQRSNSLPPLGSLSEREESGGRGPGTVSSGVGDPGGVSYGTYQLKSLDDKGKVGGTVAIFVRKKYASEFAGLTPGTAEFTVRWKELAAENSEQFRAAQRQFIRETHYDPMVDGLKKLGLDVNARSRALQNVVWSTAVQHGPGSPIVRTALSGLARTGEEIKDEELIAGIYDERGRPDQNGVPVYFKKSSKDVQISVLARLARERAEALRQLEDESRSAASAPPSIITVTPTKAERMAGTTWKSSGATLRFDVGGGFIYSTPYGGGSGRWWVSGNVVEAQYQKAYPMATMTHKFRITIRDGRGSCDDTISGVDVRKSSYPIHEVK